MASLNAGPGEHEHDAESIGSKCRVLNEKLDQLLSALHEEASPVHAAAGSPRTSVDDGDPRETGASPVRDPSRPLAGRPSDSLFLFYRPVPSQDGHEPAPDDAKCPKEAKDSRNADSRRPKASRKVIDRTGRTRPAAVVFLINFISRPA